MAGPSQPSHTLVLNSAEGLLQVVVAKETLSANGAGALVPLCAQFWSAPSQGAEILAPALRDALCRLKLVPQDIQRIACVRGPGSFTGLRLALATAAGLVRATGAVQAGLDYMPLLAESARMLLPGEDAARIFWVLTHARRRLVHMQGFTVRDDVASLTGILVASPEKAAEIVCSYAGTDGRPEIMALGSGLTRNRSEFEQALGRNGEQCVAMLPPAYDHPGVVALLRAAERAAYSANDVQPLYVRPSDAEENLEAIALSLGLDPEAARNKLEAFRRSDS